MSNNAYGYEDIIIKVYLVVVLAWNTVCIFFLGLDL